MEKPCPAEVPLLWITVVEKNVSSFTTSASAGTQLVSPNNAPALLEKTMSSSNTAPYGASSCAMIVQQAR